ncbi:MAG: NUDIX domain-containing protein [Actinomycetota bacterium]|nr:NUDIX domain-containing protein [Actinomycetota bacterium]MDQ2958894.1 NUDIX domain-containing protein [Actinomycetota bacterium]
MSSSDFDTRLAAYAVIVNDQQQILLALWNGGPELEWSLPGGGVELAESLEEAAVRELREETGYQVELTGLLGVDTNVVPAERLFGGPLPLKGVRVIYRARIIGGELANEVNGSTDEARWLPLAEVPELPRASLVDAGIALWRAGRRAEGQG